MDHTIFKKAISHDQLTSIQSIVLGAGCFWGAERKFWSLPGVVMTSVGYAGGDSVNPTYEQVCYENTNHAEVVKVIYDAKQISIHNLLKVFWECHDPTQGMRQGNDKGTQYRSVIYCSSEKDLKICEDTKNKYQDILLAQNYDNITTEIILAPTYYLAEEYHQQYLAKNPNGYCGLGGTGCSIDL